MSTAAILLCALALDAVMGEPKWLWSRLPHPAVLMGNLIGSADRRFNHGKAQRVKGTLVMVALGALALCFGLVLSKFGFVVEIILAAILIAQKSLVEHVKAVADGLRISLHEGRKTVAMIVGRDTAQMDEPAIARSAIESAAENLSDGVIAPAFWFLLGGLPALLLYKITNTADSMIGYRTPRHEKFGWTAARFDDLLNLIPARLTGFMIAASYRLLRKWSEIAREARLHRSPNAGWPEAAMARALDVALSGPRSYDGTVQDFPFVNDVGRKTIGAQDIDAACRALWITWAFFAALVFALWVFGL
ncbi:adenosylcobinamide-phosphate synthase CbiB [Planktotalea sp.]|uniref:adenosylcobinamide-phosphate synthase CbiB n=1 Tax=Planktotalea sp. TaxID=2029877 RepID=UPI0032972478